MCLAGVAFHFSTNHMIRHAQLTAKDVSRLIKQGKIRYGGNAGLRIYGLLSCASGKKMKRQNRVFFAKEQEAINAGYRPCGHCLKARYEEWKNGKSHGR